jgi:hypothetical protein
MRRQRRPAPSRRARVLALASGVAVGSVLLLAPQRPAGGAPPVPAPESVLGFVPGEDRELADWAQVLAYLRALDEASQRVSVEEVGRTTGDRPFVIATVTSEANHARLEAIRHTSARLADPRGLSDGQVERLVREGKTVVAMAYSIHSTEVGGTLASLRLLHHLAASGEDAVRAMLEATILLVIPSHNPDGTDLVAHWYRRQLGTPFEGTSPPVLYHPYVGHDNNRDWYMFTQAETRLTVRHLYHRWHPQIVHDAHQMGRRGARLFVPPYADPWEPNVDGALVAAVNALGSHVASRLTTAGRTGVVTGAIFDAWTPGRAYPHTHGGVRLLSETASARLATPLEVKAEELGRPGAGYDPRSASANFPDPWPGGTWRLADVVETQLQASLAILEHAAANREHWLRTSLAANRRASARSEPFAFVLPVGQRDPSAVVRLVEVLRLGEVEVHQARAPFEAGGRRHEAGALVVRMQQPASGFAKTVLERQRYPDRREHQGGPPRRPYDVAAHTLPLLLGVEAEAVATPFEADLDLVEGTAVSPGLVEDGGRSLALGHASGDLVALGRLLERGVAVRWALEPFVDGGRRFPAGTLLVPRSARRLVEPLASELGILARAVRASPRALRLHRPRVGLYRSWVPSMDEGWTRFVFEKEMSVAYRTLHDREVRAGRLSGRFDAIVLPDQAPAALLNGHAKGSMPEEHAGGLGSEGVAALRSFVEEGGTLVALDSASLFAIEQLELPVRNTLAGVAPSDFFCPGSILRAEADATHPLVDREGVDRATVAGRRARAQQRVVHRLLGGLERGLKERRQGVTRHDRQCLGGFRALAYAHALRRRERDGVVAAAVAVRCARAPEAEQRPCGEPFERPGIERRVGRHHDHARPVRVRGPPRRRERMAAERPTDRDPIHREDATEVRLHEDPDDVTAMARRQRARGRADATLPAEGHRSRAGADCPLFDRSAAGALDRLDHVRRPDRQGPDVVQAPVVGLADEGVDRSHRLVARSGQCVGNHTLDRGADSQRVRQDDGRLDGAELAHLRRPGELAEGVADEHAARHLVEEQIAAMGHDGRDSGADRVALDQGDVADAHAGDVGDGVERPGRKYAR